jgi:hypothetical protein
VLRCAREKRGLNIHPFVAPLGLRQSGHFYHNVAFMSKHPRKASPEPTPQ